MKLHPYLVFNGQAKDAITFYTQALPVSLGHLGTYENSPVPNQPEHNDWIVHAELLYKDQTLLMISDSPDVGQGENPNVHISLNFDDLEQMKNAFHLLSEGGKVVMPLEKQFWNATFGQLIDCFGIHWMMNCDHLNKTESEIG